MRACDERVLYPHSTGHGREMNLELGDARALKKNATW